MKQARRASRRGRQVPQVGTQRTRSAGGAVAAILVIYFLSGACSLMDEVVWVRLLKLTLGNTVFASSIVVSVFMGGLALGALVMSRWADRVQNQLRLYAILETLVTVTALALPWALRLADRGYVAFFQAADGSQTSLLVAQVVVSSLLLLVPTMLMGSTLPLLGRFVTSLEAEAGRLVGRLYALNTLGAAVGCFLAGFVLIPQLGVMGTLYLAGGLNALVALAGWMLSRRVAVGAADAAAPAAPPRPAGEPSSSSLAFRLFIAVFFVSGLVSIGYELLWMRSVVFLMGGMTYVFSAVLTVYLIGNFLGAGVGSWLAPRVASPAAVYALILMLLGATGIAYLPWLNWLAGSHLSFPSPHDTAATVMTRPLLQSIVLFAVPTLLMGAGFPIALQAWARQVHLVGRSTGAAYAANTIGAVVGGLVTGFVLIPHLGVQASLVLLGVAATLVGLVSGLVTLGVARRPAVAGFGALAVAIVVAAIAMPSGMFRDIVQSSVHHKNGLLELVDVREGTTTTVSTHRHVQDGSLRLYSSGEDIAGDSYSHRGDQKALGHFGMLLHPNPRKVLSIGFGSGETTQCLSLHHPEVLDCVEIAPEVVEVSLTDFKHINLGDELFDKVNMVFMDAKNYLHLTDQKYDVIVNDSIHPCVFAENSSLYGKEYFEAAKARLNPGGILVSWIPTYQMPSSAFDSIYGTALEVFPHVTVWYPSTNPAPLVLLVCSNDSQEFLPSHISQVLAVPEIGDSLAVIGIENPADVLSWFICDEESLREHVADYQVNSDYRPFIEFTTDPPAGEEVIAKRFIVGVRSPLDVLEAHLDWSGVAPSARRPLEREIRDAWAVAAPVIQASAQRNRLAKLKLLADGLRVRPTSRVLQRVRAIVQEELLSLGMLQLNSGHRDQALSLASAIRKADPKSGAAHVLLTRCLLASGDVRPALVAAQDGARLDPDNPFVHSSLAHVLAITGQFAEGAEQARQALEIDRQCVDAMTVLARIKLTQKSGSEYDPDGAVTLAKRACQSRSYMVPQHLLLLAEAESRAGRADAALKHAQMARQRAVSLEATGLVGQADQAIATYRPQSPEGLP